MISQANQLAAQYEAAACGAQERPATIAALVDSWLAHVRCTYPARRGSSELTNFRDACRGLLTLYPSLPPERFGPVQLQAVRLWMVDQRLSRPVVNTRVRRIRQVFNWAASFAWPDGVNGAQLMALESVAALRHGRTKAPEPKPVQPIEPETLERTIAAANPILATMMRVQYLTGMRPGEVCAMRGDEIDMTGPTWVFRPAKHKTAHHGHTREIPLGPLAQATLQPFMRPSFLFSPAAAMELTRTKRTASRKTPLSCGNRIGTARKASPKKQPGDCYTAGSYLYAIRYVCMRIGIKPWSPNRIRHLRLTEIRSAFGLEAAQAIGGHERIETTQVYAERQLSAAIDAALRVG